ncbi:helix-turn-helix domain-containing protein [Alicycliphilus denitrificans]|uniref:helix-turn-helix domain-containing protein n=1 Tax=Alicycliphilus denitrificans TaxID=179636 RepID=UPI0001D9EDF1|nr:helix-turn-helix domain-containing protein [Alicycliphilus denitrificans]ADU99808.1 CI repressor [Alicycliphilus denitrificans BC]HRP19382.1 helix-turn-helix domain-containing protein [Alicycliphilus sp.]
MNFFSDSLARLKHYLRVSKDQEVAAALGLSKTAFSERKKRNSFPEKELRALAEQRPELGIDVGYVLTGQSTEDAVNKAIASALHPGREGLADVGSLGPTPAVDELSLFDRAMHAPRKRRQLIPGRLCCEADEEEQLLMAYRDADDQGKSALLLTAHALAALAQEGKTG